MFGYTKRPLLLIAWKNLKTYPVRIFLTTSSIILGVSVIIAANIFSESNKNAFDNLFSGVFEGIDLVVQPVRGVRVKVETALRVHITVRIVI